MNFSPNTADIQVSLGRADSAAIDADATIPYITAPQSFNPSR
jgi:hypothetical protein